MDGASRLYGLLRAVVTAAVLAATYLGNTFQATNYHCDVRLGLPDLAVRAMDGAVARDPGNWEIHYGRALVLAPPDVTRVWRRGARSTRSSPWRVRPWTPLPPTTPRRGEGGPCKARLPVE